VLDDRAERRLVEVDGGTRTGDPELRLDAVQPDRLPSTSVLGGPQPRDGLSSSEIVTWPPGLRPEEVEISSRQTASGPVRTFQK
jgi:hypothetical protein